MPLSLFIFTGKYHILVLRIDYLLTQTLHLVPLPYRTVDIRYQ